MSGLLLHARAQAGDYRRGDPGYRCPGTRSAADHPGDLAKGAERLLHIARWGVGFDTVDLAACTAHGVAVTTLKGGGGHSVASGTVAMILALCKQLVPKQRLAYSGRWDLVPSIPGNEIQHKTLGLIGLGEIGREVVRLLGPFEMKVLVYDPYADPKAVAGLGATRVDLDTLLAQADVVSIHCPNLTPETRGLLGEPGDRPAETGRLPGEHGARSGGEPAGIDTGASGAAPGGGGARRVRGGTCRWTILC